MNMEMPTQILPWLFLGGEHEVDYCFRQNEIAVDAWIDLREPLPWNRSIHAPDHTLTMSLSFADGDFEKARYIIPAVHTIIKKLHSEDKTVLISCHEGKSRSAVTVLGILSKELGNMQLAMEHLNKVRPQVEIHPALWSIVKELA